VFQKLGCPIPVDDLVRTLAPFLDVADKECADGFGEGPTDPNLLKSPFQSPFTAALTRDRLTLLWHEISQLLRWHRVAYLLNMPDGEVDVFTFHGVATIQAVGESLALTRAEFDVIWAALTLTEAERRWQLDRTQPDEQFVLLWKHLPLDDLLIARVLGVRRSQVIGYRHKALERIRRHLGVAR
jgi:hypothetical protein